MNILIVEDNPLDADLARRELRGHQVEVATTLAEAWDRLLNGPTAWQVVVLDLFLPDGSGANLVTRIRLHHLPLAIVILSGNGDLGLTLALLRQGADDYLVKDIGAYHTLPKTVQAARERFLSETRRAQHPIRLLYAEPNAADADLLRRYLICHAAHINIETVPSGHDAVVVLRREGTERFHVILLDLRLPGVDGITLIKRLREELSVTVPILVVTGIDSDAYAVQALRLGATEWILKHPGHLPGLVHQVESAHYRHILHLQHREISEALARYQAVLDQSRDPIFSMDLAGNITLANQRLLEAASGTPEVIGQPATNLVQEEDRPLVRHVLERLNRQEGGCTLNVRMLLAPSPGAIHEWRIQAVVDQERRFFAYQVFCRDLSSYLPRAEQVLPPADGALEAFRLEVRATAHDLNNLLTISFGHLSLLRRNLPEDARGMHHLLQVDEASQRSVALIRRLQTTAQGHSVTQAPLVVADALEHLRVLARPAIPEHIRLTVQAEEGLLLAMGQDDFQRVFLNLLFNARDACPAGGTIALQARRIQVAGTTNVELRVADDGIGIPADLVPRIFDVGVTTKRPGTGSGLGLSTCRSLVQAAGGTIQVDSTPGRGTTLVVTLPLARVPQTSAP